MAKFVLVHGAWRGSWIWQRVRRRLQGQGHEVFTPTLTGCADRSHLSSPDVDLETHIEDIVNLLKWEDLSDVVLCGHSYAGCVVTGAADRMPERISALVYLDAFVPEDGQSVYDTLPPEQREQQVEGTEQSGQGWQVPPIPAAAFNVNENDRDWVDRQSTAQSIATFQQPLKLAGGIDRVGPITYILATDFPASPFRQFYVRAQTKGWKTLTIASGHDVMLDEPEELTRILLGIVVDRQSAR
jgi:pimeloyl-ACP methyl ester carboxylesterase